MLITSADFDRLTNTAMEWEGNDWSGQVNDHRFDPEPLLTWKMAYWVDGVAESIFAREFLDDSRELYEIVWDEAALEWVILTDYTAPHWTL